MSSDVALSVEVLTVGDPQPHTIFVMGTDWLDGNEAALDAMRKGLGLSEGLLRRGKIFSARRGEAERLDILGVVCRAKPLSVATLTENRIERDGNRGSPRDFGMTETQFRALNAGYRDPDERTHVFIDMLRLSFVPYLKLLKACVLVAFEVLSEKQDEELQVRVWTPIFEWLERGAKAEERPDLHRLREHTDLFGDNGRARLWEVMDYSTTRGEDYDGLLSSLTSVIAEAERLPPANVPKPTRQGQQMTVVRSKQQIMDIPRKMISYCDVALGMVARRMMKEPKT